MCRYNIALSVFLLIIYILSHTVGEPCEALHVKSHGLDLICCSSIDALIPTCEYSSYCRFEECSCHLTLREDFNCDVNISALTDRFQWKDHSINPSTLPCAKPALPNSQSPYQLNILTWKPRKTKMFLEGLCGVNVTFLSLRDYSTELSYLDFTRCMANIQNLEIILKERKTIDFHRSFKDMKRLASLKLFNTDFKFWNAISPWSETVSYIHLEKSSLSHLPKWLASTPSLQRIFISYTNLYSLITISRMPHLRSAKLSNNKIDDLNKNILNTREIYDLDLSRNNITSFTTQTFMLCKELRVLDLSFNPIEKLPYKPFIKNSKLKWLKLDGTKIKMLTADNFVGLTSLKTLSLSKTSLQSIASFSFLPLKSLKMLNLEASNLTTIPAAVTQNCGLTHLNVANNYLHQRSSLPPEVLAMLSSLSQLQLDGNPLREFPPSLLLLSKDNTRLYRQLIQTMTTLPVWLKDPCTPFYWHLHLGNKSQSFRQLLMPYVNNKRVHAQQCQKQYQLLMDQMQIYKDLESNSACSVSRRLRSAFMAKSSQPCNKTVFVNSSCNHSPSISPSSPSVLITSLCTNILFLFLILTLTVIHCNRKHR